jgi:hypothetical protein
VKKLLLLAAVAAGIGYLVKFKSEQVKTAAAKVTRDPRVQSALATASEKVEKAGPYAASVGSAVADRLHQAAPAEDLTPPPVPEEAADVAATDPVSAPEFTASDFTASEPPKVESADIEPLPDDAPTSAPEGATEAGTAPDPLTDPIETLQDADAPKDPEK